VAVCLLLALSGFLFFYGLDRGELWRTEGLRAFLGAEVLRTGNWIVPNLYGEPLLTKPPGMYDVIALASLPFGHVSEWTARLPSAVAATLTLLVFFWFMRQQLGTRAGLIAAAVLPVSLMWLDKATSAEIDMLQLAWVSAAILFFLKALEDAERAGIATLRRSVFRQSFSEASLYLAWRWWLLALVCVAGGFLTKWTAPAFFYLTVIPLLWRRRRLRLLWCRQHVVSALLAAGLCLGWVGLAVQQVGWTFFRAAVVREALVHLSSAHQGRAFPWGRAIAHPFIVLGAAMPASGVALLTLWPGLGRCLNERGQRLLQAFHCWIWPNLLFWSLVPQHSVRHSFPLYPGLAGLAALVWIGKLRIADGGWRIGEGSRHPPSAIRNWTGWGLTVMLMLWLTAKVLLVEVVTPHREADRHPRAKGQQLAALVPAGQTLYLCRLKDEGIMFYYGRPVRRMNSFGELLSPTEPMYCMLEAQEWATWPRNAPAEVVCQLRDQQEAPIVLVKVEPHKRAEPMTSTALPANVKILTVAELTQAIKGVIEDGFPAVWVAGQISNCKPNSSGHIYLTLKDGQAQLSAVIFRSIAMRLRFAARDGLEVIARGRLTVYQPQGKYQLAIEELHPKGLGALEVAFRQLCEKLFRMGYFDPKRKKAVPRFPRRVAVVTSPTGAAVRDMLEILGRRWPAAEVWVCPVRVQGDGAAQEIAAAVRLLNRVGGVDVMIVGRGGGSSDDLWAFNEEEVAQAIYQSRVPVVSAVGHEIDVTIADQVADRRALTPSEAAELVVPCRDELLDTLHARRGHLHAVIQQRLHAARDRLAYLADRRGFRFPLERVREREQKMDDLGNRLQRAVRQQLERMHQRLEAEAGRLDGLSPLNVLARGYSLTRKEVDQVVVRSPEQVRPGDRLVTHLQRGCIISRVEAAEAPTAAASPAAAESTTEGTLFAWRAHD
jgi:exodeoxyribonuclease VII large subunit